MKQTTGSGRSKSSKDKGNSKTSQAQTHNSLKTEQLKSQMQGTAEQIALNNLIHKDTTEDVDLQNKIKQIIMLTSCSQDQAEIALYDHPNDLEKAVNMVIDGNNEGEWRESGKKKKKPQKSEPSAPAENHVDSKPEKNENKDRPDRDNRDRDRERNNRGGEDQDQGFRDSSDNYRRPRRNDNRPPRLSRGRGRPDRAGDRADYKDDENDRDRDDSRGDRGFDRGERGRGRGRGFGSTRGGRRGGGIGGDRGDRGGSFRTAQPRFDNKPSTQFDQFEKFDNGPQIDTWTNDTAVVGEKEPKISNWGDNKEDWNEDIDSWTGSLAETKVFTASGPAPADPPAPVQLDTSTLTNTAFDIGALYQQHQQQTEMTAEASYINQFNQQATESIKNSIGIGSNSSIQNSISSQSAANVSALVSLQNALDGTIGSSIAGPELTGSSLTGNGFVGTSLGNSLSGTSLPVNSALCGSSLSGNGMNGSLTGNSLSSVTQSITAPPGVTMSQNAMLQRGGKPQRSKLPPPSKIPASAVEMPGHMMTTVDVQFGSLEFGADSSPFSFGGNESSTSAFSSAASSSTGTINNHVNAQQQMGQVPSLSASSEAMIPSSIMSSGLDQGSPRNNSLYQQSPYSTPTKQNPADTATQLQSPQDPLQMPGSTSDLKSTSQLLSGQSTQVSLPSTKIDTAVLNSYSSNTSYQSSGYQSHKPSSGYPAANKQGGYPGSQQYPTTPSQGQSNASQYSSQYNRQSSGGSGSQFPSDSGSQYQSGGSQYQSPPSGYKSAQTGYQSSSQSGYQSSNQTGYPSNQNQYQNYPTGSSFQNQSNYPSNQSGQSSLYPSTTTATYSNQTQQNSLYSQNSSHSGSYSNQSYLNRDSASAAGSSYPATAVTQASSPFKESQSGASSYRDNVSSSKTNRDSQPDSSVYNRDTQSASSFSDSQSMAYNKDSPSVGGTNSYPRDSTSASFKRDTKSASGAYPRDSQQSVNSDSNSYSHDSQSASASYGSREGQSYKDTQSSSSYRDTQQGSTAYSGQSGSYARDSATSGLGAGASQPPAGYSAKTYRNSTELTTSTLQTSPLPSSKLVDSFSKMTVKEGSLDNVQPTAQFDVSVSTTSMSSTSSTSLTSTSVTTSSIANTTVTSSNTTKISTLPTTSGASTKAPPNLPPGVPLMAAQQYIMGQAGGLPFYGLQAGLQGLQQPLYANFEELQYLQQRMPPLGANNVYDMSAGTAGGLPIPPTTLTPNSTPQQTVPTVLYSGSADSSKLNRVEAQSPTGSSIPTSQSSSGQTAGHQQQPPYILNYSYYYPPSMIPGAGFQYPMIPMPQVTNAAHVGTQANTQYQQKNFPGHHVQYGTNKVFDEISQQTPDFSKSPYGTAQSQPKANASGTQGTVAADIQVPGYGKTHAQPFDKQGFHAGTPPPFSLQMAGGQLPTGSQTAPLGAPTAPYGAPYGVPTMMTHQPHSQMMHHPLQDATSSNRGSQQSGSHSQPKSVSKTYGGSNWSY